MAESLETVDQPFPMDLLLLEGLRCPSRKEAMDQVQHALEQDPECPDAQRLSILLETCAPREKAVRMKAFLERLEARGIRGGPFLRALASLAWTLEQCGKGKAAVPIYERALQMDPGDSLELRHHLARCLLDLHQLRELAELMGRYPEGSEALGAWIQLLAIHKAERLDSLERALQKARRANPYVEEFLTSRRRIPRHYDGHGKAEPGSLEEALHVVAMIGEAWFSDRAALSWIIGRP